MKRTILVAGIVLLATGALFCRWVWSDPAPDGRAQAEAASRSLGTNAIKSLLVELYATNTAAELSWINRKTEVRNWVMGKFSETYESINPEEDPNYAERRSFTAMWGLRALGEPGLSVLTSYLYQATVDWDHAQYAAFVIGNEPDGITYLLPALSHANPAKRIAVLSGLLNATASDPSRTNAALMLPQLFQMVAGAADRKERSLAAKLLLEWARPKLFIVPPDEVAEALIKQIPQNIDVDALYGSLLHLVKSEALNVANSNQVMKLIIAFEEARKPQYMPLTDALDQRFRARYGK